MYKHVFKKSKGAPVLVCEVDVKNKASKRFHERLGFQAVKARHEHEPGYAVTFYLRDFKTSRVQEEKKDPPQFCEQCDLSVKSDFEMHL
jgi:RimJ/RimL family protein N-acetyltransferase